MKYNTMSESRLAGFKDSQDEGGKNHANLRIKKIMIQTTSAKILNSILELI